MPLFCPFARKPSMAQKIGNTIYEVSFHFSTTSRETMSDKINRLVRLDYLHRGQSVRLKTRRHSRALEHRRVQQNNGFVKNDGGMPCIFERIRLHYIMKVVYSYPRGFCRGGKP